jgi:hypothetical protein
VTSLFAPNADTRFQLRWRGYDPGQVDEFVRKSTAEQHRLKESLALLETLNRMFTTGGREQAHAVIAEAENDAAKIRAAAQHEADRVIQEAREKADVITSNSAVRPDTESSSHIREVATCLESSLAALHKASDLLSVPADDARPRSESVASAPRGSRLRLSRRQGLIVAAGLLLASSLSWVDGWKRAGAFPDWFGALSVSGQPVAAPDSGDEQLAAPTQSESGLVITLSARRQCWIRSVIDGRQRLERLLQANDTIMMHARDTVLLRVGDAGAVRLLINNREAKPLGADGEVISRLVTRHNHQELIETR